MTIRFSTFALAALCATLVVAPVSAQDSEDHRTGRPFEISPWAKLSDTGSYVGYLVGGGCARPCLAEGPTADDGTWGWDYAGRYFKRHVMLGWWHGRRYQGGSGAYRTDGPHILPPLQDEPAPR